MTIDTEYTKHFFPSLSIHLSLSLSLSSRKLKGGLKASKVKLFTYKRITHESKVTGSNCIFFFFNKVCHKHVL